MVESSPVEVVVGSPIGKTDRNNRKTGNGKTSQKTFARSILAIANNLRSSSRRHAIKVTPHSTRITQNSPIEGKQTTNTSPIRTSRAAACLCSVNMSAIVYTAIQNLLVAEKKSLELTLSNDELATRTATSENEKTRKAYCHAGFLI